IQFSMRSAGLLLALLATVATASWLGDDYWTLIGPRGEPIQGDPSNFARVAHYFKPEEHNRFVAFWMTNTHYPGRMFEQFGEAFKKEDKDGIDKYCARFTGERGEYVETCENFRILTVPERFKGRTIFEWVKIDSVRGQEVDKIGYNDHRICAFAYDPNETAEGVKYSDFTFGDAVPSKNVANAANKDIGKHSSPVENYLLRHLIGENHAQQRNPSHEQHVAHRQYQEREPNVQHQQQQQQAQEQQAQQDAKYQRRIADYNERLRQQQLQQQQRDQYDQQQAQQVQQPHHHHHHQQHHQQQPPSVSDSRFICDTYGRVFETKTGEDGRSRYVTYDVAAHGGVKPPCTLIGETPNVSVRQEERRVDQQQQQRQPEQRPYPVRRLCSGSRQKKDVEDDC
ncbi:hypothetical protein PENTCL1PPCAC_24739, partial [Pristionchus entomophagus]